VVKDSPEFGEVLERFVKMFKGIFRKNHPFFRDKIVHGIVAIPI